jgi:hypothetical protein
MEKTTFKELGLIFNYDENCVTCTDGSCHNMSYSLKNNIEYSVHISTNPEYTFFTIYACENGNTDSSSTIIESFTVEKEAVKFLCDTFGNFKCF